MKKIYSKINSKLLLHKVIKYLDITYDRQDFSEDDEFLQVSAFKMEEGKTFRPHKHIPNKRTIYYTQESWVVVRGMVKVYYYDIDDNLIQTEILEEGDCTITFAGGHTYESLRDGTTIYETKTGPYLGQKADKTFIETNKGEKK